MKKAFCHATHYAYNQFATTFFTQSIQCIKPVPYFLFGIVSYRAGIQKYRIGIVYIVNSLIPCHLHNRCYHFTVCHIHLASVCLYEKAFFQILRVCLHILFVNLSVSWAQSYSFLLNYSKGWYVNYLHEV